MQTNTLKLFILIGIFISSFSVMSQTKVDKSFTFRSVNKKYSILVPASYNPSKKIKMMVGMHPFNTRRWDAKSWRDTLSAFANSNNLLLVCPDGGANGSIIDNIDTAFTTVLIDSMFKWYNVDTNQVYIMGFSFGGKATYLYGFEHPEIFAGYMPIGAATTINDLPQRRRDNAVCKPVAILHGGNDSPNTRFYPMRDTLKNYTNYVWDTLMPGVGHTIDFANRNFLLTKAFKYLDSIHNLPLSVSLGKDISQCGSDSVNIGSNLKVLGGNCKYTYAWSPAAGLNDSTLANPKASVSSSANYILKVTDSEGKSAIDTVRINTRSLPNIIAGTADTLCSGVGKRFTATGGKTYLWSPKGGLSCTACDNPIIKITKSSTYYVTGTDSFGCKANDTLNLGVHQLPSIKTSNDTNICLGDTIRFKTTGGVSYLWRSKKDISDSTIGNPMVFPKTRNFFVVTGTDKNGCKGSDFVQVGVNALPKVLAGKDTLICYKSELALLATGAKTYTWSGSSNLSCLNCANPKFNGLSNTQLIVVGVDKNSCRATDTISVSVRSKISINTSADDSVCDGNSISLLVRGGTSVLWLNNTSLSCTTCVSPAASPSSTTVYSVVVTDANNCSDTGSIKITVNPLPSISFSGDTLICKGDTGNVSLTSSGKIKWLTTTNISDVNSLSPKVWPSQSGYFHLQSVSTSLCVSRDSVFIEVQNPVADFTISGSGPLKTLDKSASTNYDSSKYDFGGAPGTPGKNSFEYTKNGSYTICLTVNTTEGCKSEKCKKIEITTVGIQNLSKTETQVLVFPNPVSDKFQVKMDGNKVKSIRIFDLQGKSVYFSRAQEEYTISGLPVGNYVLEVSGGGEIVRFSLIKTVK